MDQEEWAMEWVWEWDLAEDMPTLGEAIPATAEVSGEALQATAEARLVMAEVMQVLAEAMQLLAEALDKPGALAWEEAGEEDREWAEDIGVLGFSEQGSTGAATTGES